MSKAQKLFQIAQASLLKGDREAAKEVAVLAFSSADAVYALDKLLPKVQEPMSKEELQDLTLEQLAQIRAVAAQLQTRKKQHLAAVILAKVEAAEQLKLRRKTKKI